MEQKKTLSNDELIDTLFEQLKNENFPPMIITGVVTAVLQLLANGGGDTVVIGEEKCLIVSVEDKQIRFAAISRKEFNELMKSSKQK